jgi:hypothetical protein
LRQPRGKRLGRNVPGGLDLGAEGRLEVGQQPARGRVGVVERQPRDPATRARQSLDDRSGLARASRRYHPYRRVALDQLADEAIDPAARHQPVRLRRNRDLAAYDPGLRVHEA